MPEAERDKIWDDGLHFTPAGYERVGRLVAERLIEILGSDSPAGERVDTIEGAVSQES